MRKFSLRSGESVDLAKRGVLCVLSTKAWGNTKKIPLEKMKKFSGKEIPKWVRNNKGLIDSKALEKIQSHITKARNIVKAYSLPFPIEGIYLVPKDNIVKLDQELNEVKKSLKDAIEEFVVNYPQYIQESKEELKEFFDPNDYPKDIGNRFDIEHHFMEMSVPGEFNAVSPELYQNEMKKFQNMMESARNECTLFLRKAFIKELEVIVDSLTGETEDGKARRIREDTLNKVEKFFEMFKNKNIFDDSELLKEIENARKIMVGINANDLRNSEKLKEMIAEQITSVAETVDKGIISYRRKLSL